MESENQDIRWQQRFKNYKKALIQFNKIFSLSKEKALSDVEKDALIQRFEYTHELAWKVMVCGSRAMGNYRNGSDIDLTIQGSLTQRNFYDILHGLDDLNLPYMIDLSQMENINNPDLIDHINRRGKNFYERSKVLH